MIRGATVDLGGTEYTVPPLKFADLQRLLPKIKAMREFSGEITDEFIATVVDIVGYALRRNYPDFGEDQLRDCLDLGNFRAVLNATLGAAGLEKQPGEARAGT